VSDRDWDRRAALEGERVWVLVDIHRHGVGATVHLTLAGAKAFAREIAAEWPNAKEITTARGERVEVPTAESMIDEWTDPPPYGENEEQDAFYNADEGRPFGWTLVVVPVHIEP